jgi:prepilin-type processing-associated H-X9-DG protein
MRQITDGTSKVYLFGEKYIPTVNYDTAGDQNSDVGSIYSGMCMGLIRLGSSGGIYAANVPVGVGIQDGYLPFKYPPQQDTPLWPGTIVSNPGNPPGLTPAQQDQGSGMRFGSAHSGGMNMAFCDGSVHSVIYEIDATVHAMLSDRQDGNTVDASQYLNQ